MNPGAPAAPRRLLLSLLALVLAGTALGGRALAAASVTRSDLAAAEDTVAVAEQNLAAARSALTTALEDRARLIATRERLEDRRRQDLTAASTRESALRSRIATLYMSADGRAAAMVIGDLSTFSTRIAYLAAVTEEDRSALNRFVISVAELEQLQASAEVLQASTEARIVELAAEEEGRAEELTVARERLREVKAEWDRQEAARIAAEEAELRRQEEELAAQLTTTTTRPPTVTTTTVPTGSTTTTTRPDYGYNPALGAEQWRPVVAEVFADWGLDRTKCATRNGIEFCISSQVDNAIRVMACESNGVPFAENRSSGAAGLFQNLPYYWSERVNRVRVLHPDKSNLPADASIWNPEHNSIVAALLVWESREALLGLRTGAGVSPAVWPEFNWEKYATSGYGYSAWGKGPNPWGHWTCGSRVGVYDLAWVHPWAIQQSAP